VFAALVGLGIVRVASQNVKFSHRTMFSLATASYAFGISFAHLLVYFLRNSLPISITVELVASLYITIVALFAVARLKTLLFIVVRGGAN
jgi:hypothetical protein